MTHRERNARYNKTQKGLIARMYGSQRANSKQRKHPMPDYTKNQYAEWLYKNGYCDLWRKWVSSGFEKWLIPSSDRLDDTKPYTLNNLRLGTWKMNFDKKIEDQKSGLLSAYKPLMPVISSDRKGVEKYHISQQAAARTLGICGTHIHQVISGQRKQTHGYSFRKAENAS